MKFIQATIYGFGKWIDKKIDFTQNDLICFYGENESGKTTIQQFVLYILFGLPPRKLAKYKPIHSHKIGGRLIVESDNVGRFTIERTEQEVVCYLKDGEERDESWLKSELKELNRQVFESIYSFSALDLIKIKQMKQEEISNVLFSVGLTGSTTIYEAEKNLDKKIGYLFKKTGTNPIINKQITETKNTYENTMKAQEKEAMYQNKQTSLVRAQQEKTELVNEVSHLQATLLQKEKHQTLLPQLFQYQEYKVQLENIPNKQPFPEDGVSRLENIKTKLLPIQSELQATQNRLNQVKEEQQTFEHALYDQKIIAKANDLVKEKGSFEHAQEQKQVLTLELQRLNKQLEEKAQSIQMTKTEIDELHLPFHLETEWESFKQTQQNLLHMEEQQTKQHNILQKREADLTKEKAQIKSNLLPNEELEDIQRTQKMMTQTSEIRYKNSDESNWDIKQMKAAKSMLLGTSLIAALTLLLSFFMENLILLLIPLIVLTVGILQFMQTKRTIRFFITQQKQYEPKSQSFEAYAKQQEILDEQNALQAELNTIEIQIEQLHKERVDWQEQQTEFLHKEHKWMQQVERTKQAYPFLHHIELAYWIDLLTIFRDVTKDMNERRYLDERLKVINNQIKTVEENFIYFASLLHVEDMMTFIQIEEILHEQATNERFIAERQEQKQTHKASVLHLEKEKEVYLSELQALFTIAQVETEDAYLQVANQRAHRVEISSTIKQIKQQLTTMFNDEALEWLLLSEETEHDLHLIIQDLNQQLKENKKAQAKLDKQITTLELEMNELEHSDDYSTAIYAQQIEEDTLQQYANEWAILKVAQSALQQAKINYQKTHLEEVLHYTSIFFKELTNGRYEQVHAPTTKKPFQVEGNDHIVYTVDTLSQGTLDQLYIALRLAISVVMSNQHYMPFIIDDAFVHFDETRTENMMRILQQLSGEQQLIVFTCKKEIANQLDSVQLT